MRGWVQLAHSAVGERRREKRDEGRLPPRLIRLRLWGFFLKAAGKPIRFFSFFSRQRKTMLGLVLGKIILL